MYDDDVHDDISMIPMMIIFIMLMMSKIYIASMVLMSILSMMSIMIRIMSMGMMMMTIKIVIITS